MLLRKALQSLRPAEPVLVPGPVPQTELNGDHAPTLTWQPEALVWRSELAELRLPTLH
jgi:hypothetical protein